MSEDALMEVVGIGDRLVVGDNAEDQPAGDVVRLQFVEEMAVAADAAIHLSDKDGASHHGSPGS